MLVLDTWLRGRNVNADLAYKQYRAYYEAGIVDLLDLEVYGV